MLQQCSVVHCPTHGASSSVVVHHLCAFHPTLCSMIFNLDHSYAFPTEENRLTHAAAVAHCQMHVTEYIINGTLSAVVVVVVVE